MHVSPLIVNICAMWRSTAPRHGFRCLVFILDVFAPSVVYFERGMGDRCVDMADLGRTSIEPPIKKGM